MIQNRTRPKAVCITRRFLHFTVFINIISISTYLFVCWFLKFVYCYFDFHILLSFLWSFLPVWVLLKVIWFFILSLCFVNCVFYCCYAWFNSIFISFHSRTYPFLYFFRLWFYLSLFVLLNCLNSFNISWSCFWLY